MTKIDWPQAGRPSLITRLSSGFSLRRNSQSKPTWIWRTRSILRPKEKTTSSVSRTILDAGALIALDKNDPTTWRSFNTDINAKRQLLTHAGIVGQVWRKPATQARLATALRSVQIDPLNDELAKTTGLLLARNRTSDVHVGALAAMRRGGDVLYTSGPEDPVDLLEALNQLGVRIVPV